MKHIIFILRKLGTLLLFVGLVGLVAGFVLYFPGPAAPWVMKAFKTLVLGAIFIWSGLIIELFKEDF